jgi:hypothetical protein
MRILNRYFILIILILSAFLSKGEEKRITFQIRPNVKGLVSLVQNEVGLKANTFGGTVEVRVYAKEGYNFDHKRTNPNFLLGFFSSNQSDAGGVIVNNSWVVKEYWPTYCLGGFNPFCFSGSTSYVTVYSDDVDQFKKNAIRFYQKNTRAIAYTTIFIP